MERCGTGKPRRMYLLSNPDGDTCAPKAILYGKGRSRVKTEDGGLPVWWLHKSPGDASYDGKAETVPIRTTFIDPLSRTPRVYAYVRGGQKNGCIMSGTTTDKDGAGRIWLACGGSQMLKGAIDLMPLIGA